MTREYKTIGECARLWVDGFDAIDSGMIEHLLALKRMNVNRIMPLMISNCMTERA